LLSAAKTAHGRQVKTEAVLFAFDLLELDGRDLRREPIEFRKAILAKLLRKAPVRLQLSEHIEEAGNIVFPYVSTVRSAKITE
jgi:ATP-dependent DNA ligase